MSTRALEYILTQPLLCTVEAAEMAAAVAARDGDPELVATRMASKVDGAKALTKRDGVSILSVVGPISRYAHMLEDICPVTSVESMAVDLAAAVNDPSTRAILIDIDSPGGEAKGIAEMAGLIREAGKIKPVCAYVGGEGCSGAYWLSVAASEVVVSPTAMLGSIGVVSGYKVNPDRAGVKRYEFVSTKSPMKRPDPDTEAGKASLQKRCDDLCEVFIGQVATLRGLSTEKVESDFGKGGVLIGQAAVDTGMADAVGDFESTLARLSKGAPLVKPEPEPKPGKKAVANTRKGTSMAAKSMNPFAWLSRLYDTNPEAVTAAMEDAAEASDESSANNVRLISRAFGRAETGTGAAVDADAIRKQVEAEYAAKADAATKATMAKFFAGHADSFVLSMTKAEKLPVVLGSSVKALYIELAMADHTGPLALVEGKTVERLDILTSLISNRLSGDSTVERVHSPSGLRDGQAALPRRDDGDGNKVDPDRVLTMLQATPQGRAYLASHKAN